MSAIADRLVSDYLDRLERELAGFPAARRRELVQEISGHIAEARAALEDEDEPAIRNLLDRIGEPTDIAAEAGSGSPEALPPAATKGSGWDVVALVLLLVGGLALPVVGWVIGVVLLWVSDSWTTIEKLIGTFVVPGGLALPVFLLTFAGWTESCSGPPGGPLVCTGGPSQGMQVAGIVGTVVLFVLPLLSTAFLARRRSQSLALA